MRYAPEPKPYYTVGEIRAAAFRLCNLVRGTEYHPQVAEFHDRLMESLPGSSDTPVDELVQWLEKQPPLR